LTLAGTVEKLRSAEDREVEVARRKRLEVNIREAAKVDMVVVFAVIVFKL
jgi:hypothetical protein